MAIVASEKFEEFFTTGSTSHTTASWTPTANALLIVTVMTWLGDAVPSLSGNGLTWVLVEDVANNSTHTGIFVFRAMGPAPSAGGITISGFNNAPSAFTEGCVHVCEFTGVDTSGTNGSGAIGQFAHDTAGASTGIPQATSLTVTMPSTPAATSATFGAFYDTKTPATAITPGSGYTTLGSTTQTVPGPDGRAVITEWATGGLQSASASTSTVTDWQGIAVEIKAGVPKGGWGRRRFGGAGF